ncbi:MAG: hypothetical protein C5B53_13840 [Candidatus Melainabacteria bacterium]|nr:MAG: hypothetical protein C5B53_13840 [Candidatus Melainabacteria bacterium]
MFSTSPPSGYGQFRKDPGLAMTLSLVLPGLGQIYTGEKRKGFLFAGVSICNLFLFAVLIFSSCLFNFLVEFGKAFHLTPNQALFGHLCHLSLSSPPVFLTVMFFLLFVVYAARDAYYSVLWRRQPIYPGHALTMSEATSGSYLAHCALLTDCFIFALFFLIPQRPPTQPTIIEYVNSQPTKQQQRVPAPIKSNNPSRAAGRHIDNKPIKTTPDATKQGKSSPPMPSPAVAHREPQQPTPPRMAPLAKPNFVARPVARSINPANAPQPLPRAESPTNAPRPLPRSLTPATTPLPSVPRLNLARSQSPQPVVAFIPRGAPGIGKSSPPAPMPFKASGADLPGPLPTRTGSTNFNPQPKLPSGNSPPGGPSSPGPIAVGANPGNDHLTGGPVPTGGQRGHQPGDSSSSPTPGRAGNPNPGGDSPLAVKPMLGSSLPPGLQGGKHQSGEPGIPNGDKNQNPRLDPAPLTDLAPFDFGPYMADLQRRIKRAWLPPKQPSSRQTVLVFKIHRNGEMSHLRLSQTSGDSISDQAAMAAVERAAPFRPLPAACRDDEVDIQFTFDYKVFAGTGVFRRF